MAARLVEHEAPEEPTAEHSEEEVAIGELVHGAEQRGRPEGRDEGWSSKNPLGRTGEHSELANLASFLISDQGGYINGEMVVQDGGAHLRSSGAEDLLQWTDAQWEKLRASRRKDRG